MIVGRKCCGGLRQIANVFLRIINTKSKATNRSEYSKNVTVTNSDGPSGI